MSQNRIDKSAFNYSVIRAYRYKQTIGRDWTLEDFVRTAIEAYLESAKQPEPASNEAVASRDILPLLKEVDAITEYLQLPNCFIYGVERAKLQPILFKYFESSQSAPAVGSLPKEKLADAIATIKRVPRDNWAGWFTDHFDKSMATLDKLLESAPPVGEPEGKACLCGAKDGKFCTFSIRPVGCALTYPQPQEEPRCPECGYTKQNALIHWDHHLCSGKIPGYDTTEKGDCPSGSRIGSTEGEGQAHAGSNPASPAKSQCIHSWPGKREGMSCQQCSAKSEPAGEPLPALAAVKEALERIAGTLDPISQQDWHGKWRIQSTIEIAQNAHSLLPAIEAALREPLDPKVGATAIGQAYYFVSKDSWSRQFTLEELLAMCKTCLEAYGFKVRE